MSILNKNINDITYADIEQLVNVDKPAENEFLDYKRELPRDKIHELISAFANTYGGWIIIGVSEDPNTNKPKNIVGVEEDNLSAFIESICIDRISPPVFCNCRFVENESKDKRVFVIKVDESDLTPHAVDYNTTVYIKIKEQKRPYKKADLDRIEWLRNRRKRFEDLRETLILKNQARVNAIFGDSKKNTAYSECTILPKYPRNILLDERELLDEIRKDDELNAIDIKTANNCLTFLNHHNRENYSEFNTFGGYYNFVLRNHTHIDEPKFLNKKVLILNEILGNLITNLYLGQRFLTKLSAQGKILLSYRLSNIKDNNIVWKKERRGIPQPQIVLNSIVDNSFEYKKEFELSEFANSYFEIFRNIVDNMVFSLGGGVEYSRNECNNATEIIRQKYLF